ncbi:hypothetical protein C8R43DRAFT_1134671 [Mycena crocata]|nr:hypothetical protein C8R43DRAFT_1134671 [Mycena crocata]
MTISQDGSNLALLVSHLHHLFLLDHDHLRYLSFTRLIVDLRVHRPTTGRRTAARSETLTRAQPWRACADRAAVANRLTRMARHRSTRSSTDGQADGGAIRDTHASTTLEGVR